jgi:hypothetical protein
MCSGDPEGVGGNPGAAARQRAKCRRAPPTAATSEGRRPAALRRGEDEGSPGDDLHPTVESRQDRGSGSRGRRKVGPQRKLRLGCDSSPRAVALATSERPGTAADTSQTTAEGSRHEWRKQRRRAGIARPGALPPTEPEGSTPERFSHADCIEPDGQVCRPVAIGMSVKAMGEKCFFSPLLRSFDRAFQRLFHWVYFYCVYQSIYRPVTRVRSDASPVSAQTGHRRPVTLDIRHFGRWLGLCS